MLFPLCVGTQFQMQLGLPRDKPSLCIQSLGEPLASKNFEKLAVLQVSRRCRSLLQVPSFKSLFDLGQWASQVAQWKRIHLPNKTQFPSLGWEDPLEKGMATHSSFCLGNPMHRGSWWATARTVATSLHNQQLNHYHHLRQQSPASNFPGVQICPRGKGLGGRN